MFAAFAVIFLFTSAKMRVKQVVLWLFSFTVLIHASALAFRGRYEWIDWVIIVNGIALLTLIGYMSYKIYTRFVRRTRAKMR